MFDWACKVTTIAFNISFPLLISVLGDAKFGDGQGKIVFSYLTTLSSILVSLSYLTFTSVFEYSLMKRKGLSRFAFISSFFLMLFIFCFVGDAIYLACFLVVVSKVSQSISQIAYDSLLDAISKGRDPHSVSTRGYIAGYSGMLAFLVYAAPILGVLYGVFKVPSLWYEGIAPSVLAGTWYMFFLIQVERNLPKNLGQGIAFPFHKNRGKSSSKEVMTSTTSSVIGNNNTVEKENLKGDTISIRNRGESGDSYPPPRSPHRSSDQLIDSLNDDTNNSSSGSTTNNTNRSNKINTTPGRVSFRTVEEVVASIEPTTAEINSSENIYPSSSSVPTTITEKVLQGLLDWYVIIKFSFIQGSRLQYENIIEATKYRDLSWFIVAFIFLSGSSNTAQSVAVIVSVQILNLGIEIVILATIVGLFSAIAGIAFFKYVIFKKWITPQYVLVINVLIIVVVLVFVLYIKTASQLLIAAAVTGTQIGPIGALSRSIVSSLIPSNRQSRLFSLYQFSQDSTSWIGSLIIASVSSAYGGSNSVYLTTVVIVCVVEIALGLPCLLMMNYNRGVLLRKQKEEEEEEEKGGGGGEGATVTVTTATEQSSIEIDTEVGLQSPTLASKDSFKDDSTMTRSLL